MKEVLQTSQRTAVSEFNAVQVAQATLISLPSSSSSSPEDMSCISDGSGVLLRDLLDDVEDNVEDDLVVEAEVEVEEEEEEEGLGCLAICLDCLSLANSASKEFFFPGGAVYI